MFPLTKECFSDSADSDKLMTAPLIPENYLHQTHNYIMSGGMAEWLLCFISNLRIADSVGSNPVRDKPLFPRVRNVTFIA
jgi:hypothetical protein